MKKQKEIVYLGPKLDDCQIILRPTDDDLEIDIIYDIKDGESVSCCDIVSLEPCEDGNGYYMERIIDRKEKREKINTIGYHLLNSVVFVLFMNPEMFMI
jgi:hypothetical protein